MNIVGNFNKLLFCFIRFVFLFFRFVIHSIVQNEQTNVCVHYYKL